VISVFRCWSWGWRIKWRTKDDDECNGLQWFC